MRIAVVCRELAVVVVVDLDFFGSFETFREIDKDPAVEHVVSAFEIKNGVVYAESVAAVRHNIATESVDRVGKGHESVCGEIRSCLERSKFLFFHRSSGFDRSSLFFLFFSRLFSGSRFFFLFFSRLCFFFLLFFSRLSSFFFLFFSGSSLFFFLFSGLCRSLSLCRSGFCGFSRFRSGLCRSGLVVVILVQILLIQIIAVVLCRQRKECRDDHDREKESTH